MNLQQLNILEAIRLAKAQYCRAIDTKQWNLFTSLLATDADITFYNVQKEVIAKFNSTQDFVKVTREFLVAAQTSHQIHNSEIEMKSDTEVSAIWSMEDYLVFPANAGGAVHSMHGYGHYHETWKLENNHWVITKLELHRTILENKEGIAS